MSEIPNERRRLADYLSEYAAGVVEEWMRIVDVEEDALSPGSGAFQPRARWAGDGTFDLSEGPHGDAALGRYRLIVKVEALPDPPPIGPENDPAQIEEQREQSGFCTECIEGDEDPRVWCDCLGDDPPCKMPCKRRAHSPERCPSHTEWIASTFLHIEQGDRLRIGQEEATAVMVSKPTWHADVSDPYRPKAWEHVQVRADVGFGPAPFPSDTVVEILCDEERKAQLIMSEAGLESRRVEGDA